MQLVSVLRRATLVVACGLASLATFAGSARAEDPPTTDPTAVAEPTTDPTTGLPLAAGPLLIVPAGCSQPTPALAVFRGTLVAFDDPTDPSAARLRVSTLLAGTLPQSTIVDQVDVSYGTEARFLEVGTEYIVGVRVDPTSGLLVSAVGEPAPLFGGDAVIGLDDTSADCPVVPDPVRTLFADGSAVDTSVLAPLGGAGGSLLRALVLPLVISLGALVALVALKQLLFGIVRSARDDLDAPPSRSTGRSHARR